MIVVSDTTPISELAKIGRLTLLRDVYERVLIPNEVYKELTTGDHPAITALETADWIEVYPVSNTEKVISIHTSTGMGLGECAAFVLAEEISADKVLVDDRTARREAKARGLPITGTIGTLLVAKQQGYVSNIKELLDDLILNGTRISRQLYKAALAAAKE